MIMETALVTDPSPLDTKTLLARINARIVLLRTWLAHDHGDEPYWWARKATAARAQQERATLRLVANLLHVERATARGRLHGTQFATLEAQQAWLAQWERRQCATAATFARVPNDACLVALREGNLPR